jgi:hypothetical protein
VRWKTTLLTLTRRSIFSNTAQYRDAFTWGDCGYLAVALSNATGFDIATASVDTADSWIHAGVWLDEQHIVDIRGIHGVDNWLADWEWAADNGWGYEEYSAVRWKAVDFAPSVVSMPRTYPDIDLDEAVRVVLANINS